MNREIKFRAWDFGNKRMVLGEAIGFTFITNTVFQDGDISATGEILLTEKVKLSELMQYTGLKDKNGDAGQEVYEGDIIDEYGKIKGNIYEMDATDSDLIITNLTERDWSDTYKKAMDRGLTHSK